MYSQGIIDAGIHSGEKCAGHKPKNMELVNIGMDPVCMVVGTNEVLDGEQSG